MKKKQVVEPQSNKNIIRFASDPSAGAGFVLDSAYYSGSAEETKSEWSAERLSFGELSTVISLLLLGSVMQAIANGAIEAIVVMLLFLFIGSLIVSFVFSNRKPEKRAFLLTYAVCIFVGGLAQIYSLAAFNMVQSTVDARGFLSQIAPQPPFSTFASISSFGTNLAIVIWQQFYKLTWWLGFRFGPYTGVMVNAMVMGLTASLTVRIAGELFGDDHWRLRRAGTLAAANGLFILFGAILLRDSFTTFFMTLMLWGGIHLLVRVNLQSLLVAAIITGVSAWAMLYLRPDAFLLIFLYGTLAFLFWLFGRSGVVGLAVASLFLLGIFVGGSFLSVYFQDIQVLQTSNLYSYTVWATLTEASDSLGLQFLYNQPLPIRLVLGSVTLMISPIPLWALFTIDSMDYHWIKGYNGIYQLLVLPLVFAGSLAVLRLFFREMKRSWPLVFLVMFLLINFFGVAATSLETRHLGQFMSAFVIIATIPDSREKRTEYELRRLKVFWVLGVAFVHVAWAILKIMQ